MTVPAGHATPRSALAPETIDAGAVVTFDGDTLITSGEAIIDSVESRLSAASAPPNQNWWLSADVPVLSRGEAWIVPLFWLPPTADRDLPGVRLLDERGSELGQSIMSACWYRQGDPLNVELDQVAQKANPYAAVLAQTGAKNAVWWAFDQFAVVLVHYAEPHASKSKMALHVVPVGWVSSRRPTKAKKMPVLDLSWSWADVVGFASSSPTG
ncbi:hypothetical protein WDU99_12200 [Microbacterium sp. Mu-80]|uniref:Uncharacterized protein n=1 Tax=Microbacterium bandirmense TaxID=3122050 RepID=A0ABU8LCK7_9MICO